MKKQMYPALVAIVLFASAFTAVNNNDVWKVKEENYSVKFTSKKFDGAFKGLKSEIRFDENNLSGSSIVASIDATSINTGNGMRNKHARLGLGAEQFQRITFTSTSIVKTGTGYEAAGNLTIKDVTKNIQLPFTFTKNSEGGVFEGKFTVRPADYNVTRSGTPEEIEIQLNVPVTK